MCQRLYHKGYLYIKNIVSDIIKKYNIPITYMSIYHCDGKWMMPHDLDCENHPYKYGYGKLYHSGYHFIDLASELIKLNNFTDESKRISKIEMYNTFMTPNDELGTFNCNDYRNIFNQQNIPEFYYKDKEINFDSYGEKNIYSILSCKNDAGQNITTVNLNLLQNGFSRRGWIQTKKDEYKGNGRIRHESVILQIGPLMSIHVHSYQSKEIKERTPQETDFGGLEHFDIDIYRNIDIIGGKPFERIRLNTLYDDNNRIGGKFQGFNELSRECGVTHFLANDTQTGELNNHKLGIELLYNCSIALKEYYEHKNKIKIINVKNLL